MPRSGRPRRDSTSDPVGDAVIWLVIWVVLMLFWLFYGGYSNWNPAAPAALGNTLIPWLCVLILGLVVFGAISSGPVIVTTAPAPARY